jgi:hypothetical protein
MDRDNGKICAMKMSKRNELLIDLQEDIEIQVLVLINGLQLENQTKFTPDEIKGALQHVILTYSE